MRRLVSPLLFTYYLAFSRPILILRQVNSKSTRDHSFQVTWSIYWGVVPCLKSWLVNGAKICRKIAHVFMLKNHATKSVFGVIDVVGLKSFHSAYIGYTDLGSVI